MKFSVSIQQEKHFHEHGFIELEELLSIEQILQLKERLQEKKLLRSGYDLFRQDEKLRRWICHRRLAEIAAELTKLKSLRIGFDVLFNQPLFNGKHSLQEISCLQGIACGLLINLQSQLLPTFEDSLFPRDRGNGVFFTSEHPIDFSPLQGRSNYWFLMIVYTELTTVLKVNRNDPQLLYYKKLGYQFGDKIRSDTHPIILK